MLTNPFSTIFCQNMCTVGQSRICHENFYTLITGTPLESINKDKLRMNQDFGLSGKVAQILILKSFCTLIFAYIKNHILFSKI